MATKRLNDRTVSSLKPRPGERFTDYYDAAMPGFLVRVFRARVEGAACRKVFMWRQRVGPKQQRLTLTDVATGAKEYPALSLARARELARATEQAITEGHNPAVQRAQARELEKTRTVAHLADLYIEKHARPNKKTWRADQTDLRTQLPDSFRRLLVTEVRRADVYAVIDAINERGARIRANRVHSLIRKMFNFGISRSWLEHNPATLIERTNERKRRRKRVLDEAEIVRFWRWFDEPRIPAALLRQRSREDPVAKRRRVWPLLAAWMRLRLVTAQRGENIVAMKWADLDLRPAKRRADGTTDGALWIIPELKADTDHRVPLSKLALDILRPLHAARADDDAVYVFESILSPLDRRHVCTGLDLPNFQFRDLRRTASTHMRRLRTKAGEKITREVVSRNLNHQDDSTTAIYDRFEHDAERRAALDAWSAELLRLLRARGVRAA